jgi:hypothetical protein
MTFASSRSTGAGLAFRKSVIRYQRKSSGRVLNGRFVKCTSTTGHSGIVKSFGRRQAYESPRGRNPWATVDGYGDFDLRLVSAMARPPPASGGLDAAGPFRLSATRYCRLGARPDATRSASMITMDTRGSVARGWAPAAERWSMPCRVMESSPGSSPWCPAVRAAVATVRTSR